MSECKEKILNKCVCESECNKCYREASKTPISQSELFTVALPDHIKSIVVYDKDSLVELAKITNDGIEVNKFQKVVVSFNDQNLILKELNDSLEIGNVTGYIVNPPNNRFSSKQIVMETE